MSENSQRADHSSIDGIFLPFFCRRDIITFCVMGLRRDIITFLSVLGLRRDIITFCECDGFETGYYYLL